MKNNGTLAYSVVLIIGDFLALLAAFSLAYIIRVKFDPRPLIEQIPAQTYFFAVFAVLPLWIMVHGLIGLYNSVFYEKRFTELGRLFVGSFLGILVLIGYDFVTQAKLFPARLVPIYGLCLGFGFLVIFRTLARFIRRSLYGYGYGISNVLIIGDTAATDTIGDAIRNTPKTGQKVVAAVAARSKYFKTYPNFSEALERIKTPIHSIIQTELYTSQEKNDRILRYAQEHHIAYRFVPGNSDLFVGNISVDLFAGSPMIAVHQTALIGWGRIAKRLFDLVFGFVALIVSLPFMLIVAVLIKLFDHGPLLLRQTRLTRFNQKFTAYKFRTHRATYNGLSPEEAFKKLGKPELIKKYRENGDHLADDPRISKFGRLLRATSLDELPQLINIVKGDISLVGPRALVPEELDQYAKKHTILSVKSGLTGLAQVSGRRDISFAERRQLDTYYVQNWSFWMDISILAKTLRAVLSGSGAK